MSRYTILVLLNAPLIIAGILNATVSYKMKHTSRRRFIFRIILWTGIFASLVFAESIYGYLFSNNLTTTEPLSLFDVVQITGIVLILFISTQAYAKADSLEKRMQDLHQELSIRLMNDTTKHK